MNRFFLKSWIFAIACGFWAFCAPAAVSLFSDYGQIQNVQNYSSNPFWSPTAPYNQRLPQPVYVQGADLNADDCIKVVQSLVAAQCMARDNCRNTDLSDIRPTIMVQLSNLPGHNYVSSCSGYLDNIFENYVKQYGTNVPNRKTAFPNATTPNPNADESSAVQFQNPYKKQPTKWQQEYKERSDELKELQSQNGVGSESLKSTNFPTTYADLSFSERMKNDAAGLEPFKDLKPYQTLNAKTTEEWCADHGNTAECLAWKCGTNGKDKTKPECIAYRCADESYYNSHKQECICSKDRNSFDCMDYRCHNTTDKDLPECIDWLCTNDGTYKANNPSKCINNNRITLDSNGATNVGTPMIYYMPGGDAYLDSAFTKKMDATNNAIELPELSDGSDGAFLGYFSEETGGVECIAATGFITTSGTSLAATYSDNVTWYAHWDLPQSPKPVQGEDNEGDPATHTYTARIVNGNGRGVTVDEECLARCNNIKTDAAFAEAFKAASIDNVNLGLSNRICHVKSGDNKGWIYLVDNSGSANKYEMVMTGAQFEKFIPYLKSQISDQTDKGASSACDGHGSNKDIQFFKDGADSPIEWFRFDD